MDLGGAAIRFARNVLFAAMIDPNEVAPLQQTTKFVTDEWQVYNDLVMYESPDTAMLKPSPDTVVGVDGVRKGGMRNSSLSLMPVDLLNHAGDQELAICMLT
jgi:hypothetical protein